MQNTYDVDFYAWANTQAALLRSGRIDQADIEHIVEEIESMGKSELRELENPAGLPLHYRADAERRGAGQRTVKPCTRGDFSRRTTTMALFPSIILNRVQSEMRTFE